MESQKVINEKFIKYLKIAVVVVIVVLFLWFLVIHPLITFHSYETEIENAAKRYYEINERELPTGTRVKTLSVQELFDQSYLKNDFYVPFSKKPCSIKDSWVKVRQEDGEYKYYTYLKCGVISSNVDHKGPEITLKGDEKVTIDLGSKYKEEGVQSVVDNTDGKMDIKDVEIDASAVNTNKAGTYQVVYTATDSLNNTNEVTRTVKVVARLKNTVNKATNKTGIYTGSNPNNYIYFSNILFRIIDVDGDDVRIVAAQDISSVNYSSIDNWLEYFYDNLTDNSKKYIVKNKYCNQKLEDGNVTNVKKCNSYTDEVKASILSFTDINSSIDENGNSYLYPGNIIWTNNSKNGDEAYTANIWFFTSFTKYKAFNKDYNFGVRPVLTIKGDTLIIDGDGTLEHPYSIGDVESAKDGDKTYTRYVGEYVSMNGRLYRIIGEDGKNTKVISIGSIYDTEGNAVVTYYDTDTNAKIYNPKEKGNIGYFINNNTSQYINDEYFVNKTIEVPIYKNQIKYGKEVDTKEYKVKFSAPNLYEMFSASDAYETIGQSYWYLNSSRTANVKAAMSNIGTMFYDPIYDSATYGVRIVGFLDEDCSIVRGDGTYSNPYVITK